MTPAAAHATRNQVSPGILALAAFAAGLVVRLVFVLLAPTFGGDGRTYLTVAQNIAANGCVSLSDPATAQCVPHWGGNHLPGYPAFIAAMLQLMGGWELAPLVGQAVAAAAAAAYLAWVTARVYGPAAGIAAGFVAALSPTLIAWPRMLLTETIAGALTVWIVAELIRSIAERRVRVVPLGFAFAAGCFVRYDFVLMAVPTAIVGFAITPIPRTLRAFAMIAVIVAVPSAAWWARCVAAGLPWFPPFGLDAAGEQLPEGTLAWMGTWVARPYDLLLSDWPLVTGSYSAIRGPDPGVVGAQAPELLAQLNLVPNHTRVPAELDRAFAELAAQWTREHPFQRWILLPLHRAAGIWGNPFASLGWPIELDSDIRAAYAQRGLMGALAGATAHFAAIAGKAFLTAWRGVAIIAVAAVVGLAVRRRAGIPLLLTAALGFALVRTVVFAETILVETRYLVPVFIALEIAVAIAIAVRAEPCGGRGAGA